MPKNWCFETVVLEKTLESPLDCKEIKPINPKGNQSWMLIGRTDDEAEAPILWPPDVKNWLLRKDPEAGKDWRQEEKGTTEDEMVGWHHWLSGPLDLILLKLITSSHFSYQMQPRIPFSLELIPKQLEGMDRGSRTDIHSLDCIPVPVLLPLTSGYWQL